MTTLDAEVFEVFQAMGAPQELALRAASTLRKHDDLVDERLARRDEQILAIQETLARHTADFAVIKWMMGTLIVLVVLVLGKMLA